MASTTNYIDESERLFSETGYVATLISQEIWTTTGTLQADAITYQDAKFGSLKLTGGVSESVFYNAYDISKVQPSQYSLTTFVENSDYIEAYCSVKVSKNATVSIRTTLYEVALHTPTNTFRYVTSSPSVVVGEFGSRVLETGHLDDSDFQIVRAVPVQIPDDEKRYSIAMEIKVEYSDSSNIGYANISRPTLIRTHAWLDNNFLNACVRVVPRTFLSQDFADFLKNKPTFPLMRLLDVLTNSAGEIFEIHDSITHLLIEEGFDSTELLSLSTLISPEVADLDTLRWLAQFRGRNLVVTYEPSTEGAEWQLFVLDESELDGVGVLATSSASLIGISGGVIEYFRWQVETGYYGHNAGTLSALISSIQLLLTGSKTVTYDISPTGNEIKFYTNITETFKGDLFLVGDSSPFVLAVLEPARPLGLLVTHEFV